MSVVVNDVATDHFADHGADQDIGREMIQTSNTCQANRSCKSIGSNHDKRFVVVFAGQDCRQYECARRVS